VCGLGTVSAVAALIFCRERMNTPILVDPTVTRNPHPPVETDWRDVVRVVGEAVLVFAMIGLLFALVAALEPR
jgi:hypothetical protein